MMTMSHKPPTSSASRIAEIGFVVFMTFVTWCLGLGLAGEHGKSVSRASSSATIAALCGLVAWATSYLVNRRQHGNFVAFIMVPGVAATIGQETPSLPSIACFLGLYVIFGLFLGLAIRGSNAPRAKKPTSRHAEPLYDAQLDQTA
jgi:hypothetical protein